MNSMRVRKTRIMNNAHKYAPAVVLRNSQRRGVGLFFSLGGGGGGGKRNKKTEKPFRLHGFRKQQQQQQQQKEEDASDKNKNMNEQKLNSYVDFIINALFDANKYFNDQEPWKKKDDLKRLKSIIYTSLELIRKISILLYPVIPQSSLKALSIFKISEEEIKIETIKNNNFLKSGTAINKIDILFNKVISDD